MARTSKSGNGTGPSPRTSADTTNAAHWLDWRTPGERIAESIVNPLGGCKPWVAEGPERTTCRDIHPNGPVRGVDLCLCCHDTPLAPLLDMVGLVWPRREAEPAARAVEVDDIAAEPVVYTLPAKKGRLRGGVG